MATTLNDELGDLLSTDSRGAVRLPALVKGRLVIPPKISFDHLISAARQNATGAPAGSPHEQQVFLVEGAWVIRRPALDRATLTQTDEDQFLILPDIDARLLVETDLSDLVRALYDLPFREVMDYIEALSEVLRAESGVIRLAADYTKATSLIHDRAYDILFEILPDLLNPQSLREAVDRELGSPEAVGTEYLDGWVTVGARSHRGITARMADDLFGPKAHGKNRFRSRVRAMPTRQLHITAGNSPIIPFLSILRALATKSAAVIKSPAESTAPAALLALAMRAVDPNHPITKHTSLVYWKGGDRRMEDILFAAGAFDRLVVWGSPETVRSTNLRAGLTKTVFMNPRYGMSFVGREAFPNSVREVAINAATDTMIANQRACISSLVHYVEASEDEALDYCRTLKEVLQRWDQAVPHTLSRTSLSRLRGLRRKDFLNGKWFENGRWPKTTSVVVYMPTEFDVMVHPMCRCVVVRRVDDLREALIFLHSGVATIGVYPEARRLELRDEIAARGVTDIFPLGECERAYAGKSHDGMRVLSELVNWTNG